MNETSTNVLEQADELVARGKLSHAIEVLRINVRQNPENRRALNKLGDLYLHNNQSDRAVELFCQVGEEFHEDGLVPQAVAMYKKAVRIEPDQWDVYETLGDLYKELNLPFEAAAQYEIAARAYQRHGDRPAAIRAERGIVSQRPEDAAARARLAELYLATHRVPQAHQEYLVIGQMMVKEGQAEQALRVFSRVLESHFGLDFGTEAVEVLKQGNESAVAARLTVLVEQLQEAQASSEVEKAEEPTPPDEPSEEEVAAEAVAEEEAAEEDEELQPEPDEPEESEAVPTITLADEEQESSPVPTITLGDEEQESPAEQPTAADPQEVFEIDLSEFEEAELASTEEAAEHPEPVVPADSSAPQEDVPLAAGEVEAPGPDLRDLGAEVEGSMMVAAASGADVESDSIEEIVASFTQGLAEALSPDDYDTHYNLGLGYQEMGLVDEAIGEFQIAAKSEQHLVDAASMLGYAFRQRGLYDLAYEWYERARTSDVASNQQKLAMRYEQAETQYEAEEVEQAYQLYQEVYGADSTFRDVAKRIDELRTS